MFAYARGMVGIWLACFFRVFIFCTIFVRFYMSLHTATWTHTCTHIRGVYAIYARFLEIIIKSIAYRKIDMPDLCKRIPELAKNHDFDIPSAFF